MGLIQVSVLCEHKIYNKDLCKLQENLVLSHACGRW